MKKIIIISSILMLLFSCDKENTQPVLTYLDYINAGKIEGLGINYSGMINDTLFFDYPSSSTNRYIDINDDGIDDFELRFTGSASPGHSNSKNSILTIGNSFLAISEFEDNIVDTIPFNDTIDDKLNWVNDTCVIYNYYWDDSGNSSNTGLWNDVRNKYIGTKIFVDDKILFGWIRVEITYGWNLTLIEYACTVEFELE
jgi:hypothetical protein